MCDKLSKSTFAFIAVTAGLMLAVAQGAVVPEFNGTSAYFNAPYFNAHHGTLEFWFSPRDDAGTGQWNSRADLIAGQASGGNNRFVIYNNSSTNIHFLYNNSTGQNHRLDVPVAGWKGGEFYHLAFHFSDGANEGVIRAFVNGQLISSTAVSGTVGSNDQLNIMRDVGNVRHFAGRISDVRLWNTLRAAGDIQANMNIRLTGNESGLVGYWPLNEGSGSAAADLSGNGRHAVVQNVTWTTAPNLSFVEAFTTITSFSAVGADTLFPFYTASGALNLDVEYAVSGTADYDGWHVAESPFDVPDPDNDEDWNGLDPVFYDITGVPGLTTIYLYIRDTNKSVASASYDIVYDPSKPAIENFTPSSTGSSITVSWNTHQDAISWVKYGLSGEDRDAFVGPTAYGEVHSLTISGLIDGTAYDIEIHSNDSSQVHTLSTDAATPTMENVTWAGRLPQDMHWSRGANWEGFEYPALTSTATAFFTNVGHALGDDSDTSILDPQSIDAQADTWQIGTLHVRNPLTGSVSSIFHNFNLNGQELAVTGAMNVANYGSWQSQGGPRATTTATFRNGTLKLGTETTPIDLTISKDTSWYSSGTMAFGANSHLEAHLQDVIIGDGAGNRGVLDLRNTQLVGGSFTTRDLRLGIEGHGDAARWDNEIALSQSTGLTLLHVKRNFRLTEGNPTSSRIGDPTRLTTSTNPDLNARWMLPPDVNIVVGDYDGNDELTVKGNILVGGGAYHGAHGWIIASEGGRFDACLATMEIGRKTGGGGSVSVAVFDMSAMTGCEVSVDTLLVASRNTSSNHQERGYLRFPPGKVDAGATTIGGPLYGIGLLGLHGTIFEVRSGGSLKIDATGSVETFVTGESAGFDIPAGVTPVVEGTIHIVFEESDASEGAEGVYWGLRMAGDQRTFLSGLQTNGKLIIDDTAVDGTASIYHEGDYTYVALITGDAPIVIPRNITIEIDPPAVTELVIHIDDVDASPYDPDVTSRSISHPDDQTPEDPQVVTLVGLTEATTFEITLTHVKGDHFTQEAALIVILIPEGTTDSITWTGAATTTLMERPEWKWGQNWDGELPPFEPTTGILTFATQALGTNILDQDRTIGGLDVMNSTGMHIFDLNDKTLSVAGRLQVGDDNRVTSTTMLDGTLQIGTLEQTQDLYIVNNGSDWGVLTLSNVAFDANIGTLFMGSIGQGSNSLTRLDLSGATIPGGILRAGSMRLGVSVENLTFPQAQVIVTQESGLETIVVSDRLSIADGHRIGQCRFGDPNNDWKLPSGVDLLLGSSENRARLRIGLSNWGDHTTANGYLGASSDGTMTAWLSELYVGNTATGVLDLSAMEDVFIDVTDIRVSRADRNSSRGTIRLPKGTVRVDNLSVATYSSGSGVVGLIELNGTSMTVDGTATIGQLDGSPASGTSGIVRTILRGESAGVHFSAGVAPAFGPTGRLDIVFAEYPSTAEPYYGLSFAGERASDVQTMIDNGYITWDTSAIGGAQAGVFEMNGNTYVGLDAPFITEFNVTGSTGSSLYTLDANVGVTLAAMPSIQGVEISGYIITESDDEFDANSVWNNWPPAPGLSHTISADPGEDVTLYAWVIDDLDQVGSTSHVIYYQPAVPELVGEITIVANMQGDIVTSITVSWDTTISAFGTLEYKTADAAEWQMLSDSSHRVNHSFTIDVTPSTTYQLVVSNNGFAQPEIIWPEPIWCTPGDANDDGVVNILDLIFVRNRIGLPVGEGNNIWADLNEDGVIDVLDLMIVRENLGNTCD